MERLAIAAHAAGPYEQLMTVISMLPEWKQREVIELMEKATGYAWGWQDAGGDSRSHDQAWDFHIAYGMHAAEYAMEWRGSRHAIQDAFASFRMGREIGVYVWQ